MTLSLADYIRDGRNLDDAQRWHVLAIIGKGCRKQTKETLERRLKYVHLNKNYDIYTRLIVEPQVQYVCGQSWSDEMRTLRQCLIG